MQGFAIDVIPVRSKEDSVPLTGGTLLADAIDVNHPVVRGKPLQCNQSS